MNQRYEHEGKPLSQTIIRDILENHLTLPTTWLSVNDYKAKIEEYHLQRGGGENKLKYFHAQVHQVLKELERFGKYERIKFKGERDIYYRPINL